MFWKRLLSLLTLLLLYSSLSSDVISDDGTTVYGVNKYGNEYWLNRNTGTIQYRNKPGGYHYDKFGESHTYKIPNYINNSGSSQNNNQPANLNINNDHSQAPDDNTGNRNLKINSHTPSGNNKKFTSGPINQSEPKTKKKSILLLIVLQIAGLVFVFSKRMGEVFSNIEKLGVLLLFMFLIYGFWIIISAFIHD